MSKGTGQLEHIFLQLSLSWRRARAEWDGGQLSGTTSTDRATAAATPQTYNTSWPSLCTPFWSCPQVLRHQMRVTAETNQAALNNQTAAAAADSQIHNTTWLSLCAPLGSCCPGTLPTA
jgi:hypothetical protein